MMRNIIITGGELFNKGAQAMTFTAVDELRTRFPSHQIFLLSDMDLRRPQEERQQYSFDFTCWYPIKFARCQNNALLRLVYTLRNYTEFRNAEELYRNTDLMIDISGYGLGSNWSATNCNLYLDHLKFAKAFGIPIYLMPQSFGPFDFEGEEGRKIDARIQELLPYASVICARERDGYDALVSRYGLTNVVLAPDLVLNNKSLDLTRVYRTPPQLQLPQIEPDSIGVVPNGRNFDVGDNDTVLRLYADAISYVRQSGRCVYILSHCSADLPICRLIKEQFPEDDQVILLEQDFSCIEFNELVQNFRFLIASRFHSIVHAYKNGIPCLALGWAEKYRGLLEQFQQDNYLFDVRQHVDTDAICTSIDLLSRRIEEESTLILQHLAEIQKNNVFDILDHGAANRL